MIRITRSLVAVLFTAIFIVGCASTTGSVDDKTISTGERSGSQTYTSGLGQQGRFSELNSEQGYEIAPGRDQIYYFGFDSFDASPYTQAINAQSAYLMQNQRARILLEGHTDERGSREYNIGLGERRAGNVKELLLLAGVNPNQIRVVSYGEEKPKLVGFDESAYSKNRRVELIYEAK